MNLQEKLSFIADEVKKIEVWAEENRNSYYYDDYEFRIRRQLIVLEKYAKENEIPFFVNATEIAQKNYDDTDGYSEEESSSSYYEEDYSSDYDENDDEETDEDDSDY